MWKLHLLRSRISVNTFQELLCQTRPTALRMACLQSTVLKSIMFYFQSANDFSFLLTYSFIVFTGRNEVVAKVMFLLMSVILCYPSMHCRWYPSMPCSRSRGGGCYPSMHCRWYPSMSCSRSWGGYPSMPCRFPGPHPRGKFRGICLWGVSTPTAKGEVEGDPVQAHSLIPPPQQMATVADGTHPTGMHSCFEKALL